MLLLNGIGVSRGLAHGWLRFFRREVPPAERRVTEDPEEEVRRFDDARAAAVAQLGRLYDESTLRLGQEAGFLLQSHQMMLGDEVYRTAVTSIIRGESVCAEYAVHTAAEQLQRTFAQMEDEYMRARAADVGDISSRVLRALAGMEEELTLPDQPVILAANDLAPSETARLQKALVLAFITAEGSRNSHTAIFARTLGIPAVVALGGQLAELTDGAEVWVDGTTGQVVLQPDQKTGEEFSRRQDAEEARRVRLEKYKDQPAVTKDGRRVLLCANIGSPSDLPAALANGADGVGLFRSEYLFLGRRDCPTEEEQYHAYHQVAEAMGGKRVVIRTMDVGADKRIEWLKLPREENPALGLRGIRVSLARPDLFRTQLRAIYRASVHGNVAAMFPMVAAPWELERARELAAEVRAELAAEGVPFRDEVPLGAMVETPAAAVISDILANFADFFSIGTNDLTQYTLACSRQTAGLEPYSDRRHKAVLRLIRLTAKNAREAGIPVDICGELAADPVLTDFFVECGVEALSMASPAIPELRAGILDCGFLERKPGKEL